MSINLSPEDAFNVLTTQVHAPVFFEKLARVYNISPGNQEEARELLLMAGQLRNAHEQQQEKNAQINTSFISQARRDLNNTLNYCGFQPTVDQTQIIKEAAATAVQNPLIRDAALVFENFMRQNLNS